MNNVEESFNERINEINTFYKILTHLADERVALRKTTNSSTRTIRMDSEAIKVMKSTCFLLLYNLIESTIRESFKILYDEINRAEKNIDQITECYKEIWLNQYFKNIDPVSSSNKTYREITMRIVNSLLNHLPIYLNADNLPISGNLDAKKIRELFNSHRIKLKVHRNTLGGAELKTVKDKRNELAHGNSSFCECGQEYSIESLNSIKHQTILYLKGTIRALKKHIDQKKYEI